MGLCGGRAWYYDATAEFLGELVGTGDEAGVGFGINLRRLFAEYCTNSYIAGCYEQGEMHVVCFLVNLIPQGRPMAREGSVPYYRGLFESSALLVTCASIVMVGPASSEIRCRLNVSLLYNEQ